MFNLEVKFCQCFNPSRQDSFRSFESPEPLETVMVCPKNDFVAQQVVPEVLECRDDCEKFSPRGAVISLSAVENAGEVGNWFFDSVDHLTKHCSDCDI